MDLDFAFFNIIKGTSIIYLLYHILLPIASYATAGILIVFSSWPFKWCNYVQCSIGVLMEMNMFPSPPPDPQGTFGRLYSSSNHKQLFASPGFNSLSRGGLLVSWASHGHWRHTGQCGDDCLLEMTSSFGLLARREGTSIFTVSPNV